MGLYMILMALRYCIILWQKVENVLLHKVLSQFVKKLLVVIHILILLLSPIRSEA